MLKKDVGPAAEHMEKALATASRILPLITTAHCPSAANNNYWPEMYLNMSLVDEVPPRPYNDTPKPRRFGTVSPLDPQLFSTIEEHAAELLAGAPVAKYSPAEVARWSEELAEKSAKHSADAERAAKDANAPAFRRMAVDVAIQIGLGRFFAHKFRAGVLYAIYAQSGDATARTECVKCYRAARDAWAALADRAKGVYATDITFGPELQQRGHWLDRLKGIDDDIAAVERQSVKPQPTTRPAADAIAAVFNTPARLAGNFSTVASVDFKRGEPVTVTVSGAADDGIVARVYYRHVNQGEPWRSADMSRDGTTFRFTIPAAYTDSPFALQHYCELRHPDHGVRLFPGFSSSLSNEPYFGVQQAKS
jgi:hypothetical protein